MRRTDHDRTVQVERDFSLLPGSSNSIARKNHNMTNHTFTPGPKPNTVISVHGEVLTAPEGWILLPPGDAALTRRVKAAVIAWMRHQTTGYDDMVIPRVKGNRREVRRMLAQR